jgi:hypothetical protein
MRADDHPLLRTRGASRQISADAPPLGLPATKIPIGQPQCEYEQYRFQHPTILTDPGFRTDHDLMG